MATTTRKTIETGDLAKALDSDINLHVWNVLNDGTRIVQVRVYY